MTPEENLRRIYAQCELYRATARRRIPIILAIIIAGCIGACEKHSSVASASELQCPPTNPCLIRNAYGAHPDEVVHERRYALVWAIGANVAHTIEMNKHVPLFADYQACLTARNELFADTSRQRDQRHIDATVVVECIPIQEGPYHG